VRSFVPLRFYDIIGQYRRVRQRYLRQTPRMIDIELTGWCNALAGPPPEAGPADAARVRMNQIPNMTSDVFFRLAGEIGRVRPDGLVILGGRGEPALHPQFFEWLEYLRDALKLRVELRVSAPVLTPEFRSEIIRFGVTSVVARARLIAPDSAGTEDKDAWELAWHNLWQFAGEARQAGGRLQLTLLLDEQPAPRNVLSSFFYRWIPVVGGIEIHQPRNSSGRAPAADTGRAAQRRPCPLVYGPATFRSDGTLVLCAADWAGQHPGGNIMNTDLEFLVRSLNSPQIYHRRGRAHLVPLCAHCRLWEDQLGRHQAAGNRIFRESAFVRRYWNRELFTRRSDQ